MTIFITGIRGFIGSHLANKLFNDGHDIWGIDNDFHISSNNLKEGITILSGDIRDRVNLRRYIEKADVIFHLAAQIHVDYGNKFPQETVEINVNGTLNILEICRELGKPLIFASSSEVYGTAQYPSIDENHPLDAQGVYAATKVAGDRLCKAYYDAFNTKVGILRNFNTFGEGQNDSSYGGVIAIFTKAALKGEPLIIFGDGKQERDYMHVSDAIKGEY